MKKLLYLFSTILLVFASCSNDDSTTNQNSILVRRIVYTASGYSSALDFTYDGNKIVKVLTGSYKDVYTYTGDLITKVENYTDTGSSYGLFSTKDYSYTNGKLVKFTEKYSGDSAYFETVYTHNNDGTISYVKSKIETPVDIAGEGFSGKITISNGNWVKNDKSTSSYVGMITYEYDTKNSPTKNILGYNLLLNKGELGVSVNNVVKSTDVRGTDYTGVCTNTYTYDPNNYPTEQKSYNENALVNTIQYFY